MTARAHLNDIDRAYMDGYLSSFDSHVSTAEMQDALRAILPENISKGMGKR